MKNQRSKAPEEVFNEAKLLRDLGDLEGAAQALSRLIEDYPNDIEVWFCFASVLFHLKRFAEAVPPFEQVLEAQPLHEWASLGLFHSLWKSGRRQDAINEIERFFDAGGDSMEYRRLFKDMKKSG